MDSKKRQAINFIKSGDYKTALRLIKNFRIEFTDKQRESLQIAYECLAGKEHFYKLLGLNTKDIIIKAKLICDEYAR